MPRIAIVPSQYSVTSWKRRQSRPAGCSMLYDLTSGMLPRPLMMRICCSSCCSFTELAVGLTAAPELRSCAPADGASATQTRKTPRTTAERRRADVQIESSLVMSFHPAAARCVSSPVELADRGDARAPIKSRDGITAEMIRIHRNTLGLDRLAV